MRFRILGPLEVLHRDEPIPLGTIKERIVLATLVLHANEAVSRARLIDELWGESPPPTATKAVNVYVSRLRKTFTRYGRDPITTVTGGYRLELDLEDLDAAQMQRRLADARARAAAGELERASELFRETLALWRGPTLSDLPFESFARAEVEQLDEVRVSALLDRIDCDLALGRHEQVLGEVNLLVREHPLRERFRAQQMLALYRAGRQADALDAYAEARRALVDDLGIEPSDALQRLQHAILRHDPSLETPEGTAAVNGRRRGVAPPPTIDGARSRRRLRPRRPALAAAGLLVVAAAVAGAVAFSTSSARATPRVVPNSLVRFDPRRGKVVSVVSVGVEPGPIAITPNAIWTANTATISRYDLRTHHVETRGDFPYQPEDSTNDIVADGKGSVWVTSETPLLTRFVASRGGAEPLRRWRSEEIRVPGPGVGDEALGAGYLWTIPGPYTYPGADDRVSLIDPRTNRLVDSVRLGHATTALAFGFGTAWVGAFVNDASDTSGSSPNGQKVLTGPSWLFAIRAGDALSQTYLDRHPIRRLLETGDAEGPGGIAVGEGAVWVLTCPTCNLGSDHRTLEEVDPDTLRVHRIGLPAHADFLTAGAGAVWLASESEGILWRLDPKRGRIVHAYRVGRPHAVICHIRAAPNAIWIAVGDSRC